MTEFCRACGASIPHRPGEGRCETCMHYLPAAEYSAYRARKLRARIITRRNERIDAMIGRVPVRECLCWSVLGGFELRYDFAYCDPASGQFRQYSTFSHWNERPTREQLIVARDLNKRMIMRELERTCGIENAAPIAIAMPTTAEAKLI